MSPGATIVFSRQAQDLIDMRRGARVVESGGLENRCSRKGTVGSNPTLSATKTVVGSSQFAVGSVGQLGISANCKLPAAN
jgi:hypothetical protein